ncbi:hypothetical protein BU25DRAFT_462380 [Macroventuria anomochaeta]|uniref:Uncharacterized protein n=1 Tax=Macroventuria anomochaeta TaxID=301207 RepID=A0ACB6RPD5_9PLEO|nr:uncharacterized protein BU25DRAFT_462380 [Macroventuria anomochaeta]KAF2622988.1 hypothetical protein BU25DRAFT_462380 [Macroventuria anomochaeta]
MQYYEFVITITSKFSATLRAQSTMLRLAFWKTWRRACSCALAPSAQSSGAAPNGCRQPARLKPNLTFHYFLRLTVKLDSHETSPPPLSHSPRESTAASTPVTTPTQHTVSPHFGRATKNSPSLSYAWQRKPHELVPSREPEFDLLFEDSGDCSFPLFPASPAQHSSVLGNMAQTATPIDIQTPPRYGSNSPQNQTSNLTSALREAEANRDFSQTPNQLDPNGFQFRDGRPSMSERHGSISNMLGTSFYGSGARPISMRDRGRRESTNMGSFNGGMSWGGVSVGSWIRDDIMMAGTSPAPMNMGQSPSFHSSSYLPKMEAAFMKDFTCCGLTLASLHDLLQHFEETHANAPAARNSQPAQNGLPQASGAPAPSIAPGQTQGEPAMNTQMGFHPRSGSMGGQRQRLNSISRSNLSTVQDMDSLDDMDMDMDGFDSLAPIEEAPLQFPVQQPQFGQQQNQLPQLNVNLANTMQNHQGLRTSTPSTPSASQQFNFNNNPTVSSVNTPTLGTVPMQNHNLTSPESSHPGTPAELDMDFNNFNHMMGMDMGMNGMNGMNMNFGSGNFGMSAFDNNGTIDQPGKRLFSKQGGGLNQAQLQAALKNYQLGGNDQSELARRIREQQMLNGASIPQFPFPEEVKPFRCPVIGCEKAYKNQNGLKYHKQHGHQNQQLKENDDGTFSIVDPLTSIPYPGTVGMEKEKPYRCEVCGKRYKNLNGLKYHRSHAPHCNPELALQKLGLAPNMQSLQNLQNANVAGAGMGGIDPSMF